ncbi:hypothetical protein bcf_18850 [Bacillus cereus F837/76]|nr:hypothetical protein bcf_18850 [Bacillus cereus F837/76]
MFRNNCFEYDALHRKSSFYSYFCSITRKISLENPYYEMNLEYL